VLAGTLRRRDSDEAGQGLAEYALILALIAVVCIGALSALGVNIANSAGFTAIPAAL
jgi:pilus assembly protein Flp/PilA